MDDFLAPLLALVFLVCVAAWFVVLPTVGMLWLFGWLA